MLKALEEQEQWDPLIKQQVLCKIKDSLKSSTGQLKILTKTIEKCGDRRLPGKDKSYEDTKNQTGHDAELQRDSPQH